MERMFRLLKADEIECRVSTFKADKGLSLLLYKDARVDQNILDETVGPENWMRSHELINGNLFCNVSIRCKREDGSYEWVTKQDVGTESYTEKEKGQASDSFKRACFNWGIGRELYTAPFIWITPDKFKTSQTNGKPTTYDRFKVTAIDYKDGNISYLEIANTNSKKIVYTFGKRTGQAQKLSEAKAENPTQKGEKPSEAAQNTVDLNQKITKKQALTLRMICQHHEMPEDKVYGRYNRKSMEDMTIGDWYDFSKQGQEFLKKWDETKTA